MKTTAALMIILTLVLAPPASANVGDRDLQVILEGGESCRNLVVSARDSGFWGTIDVRLQVYGCSNGHEITYCYRNHWVQDSDAPWYFDDWIGQQEYGGQGASSCGRWVQAHVHRTEPWYYDNHKYPWLKAILYANGGYEGDSGGL